MAEARGFLLESIAKGDSSKGFQLYKNLAGTSLGETGDAYRQYLFSLFDEFSQDLAVLFDRHSSQGRLFPRESALLALLEQINHFEIEHLWAEDETIGWIYQYFNSQDERKKMRAESQAPRNSRELAVRNQFFTPRYVVEFLTDNTLGRIWYEMTQGKTVLVENCRYLVRRPNEMFLAKGESAPEKESEDHERLSQEELLKQPVSIPFRALKDPRDLRMLDPACGSMHFGLYAFDLFEKIYEEAWQLESELGPDVFSRPEELEPLQTTYSTYEEFCKAIPKLIIECNIHGVDIDSRAVQIAGLSLWQRAQRAWHQMGIKPNQRPTIKKSNIVCAEPMPGEKEMLREFTVNLTPPVLGHLVETIFDKMVLAGNTGALLKIEEEIASTISKAKDEFNRELLRRKKEQGYIPGFAPQREGKLFDYADLGDNVRFWDTAERQILESLSDYADQAESGDGQKRLFVGDAAKGFAFIDLFRKRFDVILMNPPFGDAVFGTESFMKSEYTAWCNNLVAAFVEMSIERLEPNGKCGVVSDRTVIVKSSYERFRQHIYANLTYLADFGWDVLDANVEVTSFVLSKDINPIAIFFDQRLVLDKSLHLNKKIKELALEKSIEGVFIIPTNTLATLPNYTFAYDLPIEAVRVFDKHNSLKKSGRRALQGHNLSMAQFGRFAWEVPPSSIEDRTYIRMYKGGEYCKYLQPSYEVALWLKDGGHLRGHSGTRWGNEKFQEKSCIGYGKRGDYLDAHVVQAGHIFTVEGLVVFPLSIDDAWWVLAVLNSSACSYLLHFYSGQHKMSGYLDLLPVPSNTNFYEFCSRMAKELYDKKRIVDRANELSPEFVTLPFSFDSGNMLRGLGKWLREQFLKVQAIDNELDAAISKSYGFDPTFLEADDFIKSQTVDVLSIAFDTTTLKNAVMSITEASMSYLVGAAFGRWDIRYVTGVKQTPALSNPFDPLPSCPPGMLKNANGLPIEQEEIPDEYPLHISCQGILVDDKSHAKDLVTCVRNANKVIWRERAAENEQESLDILGMASLRDYFKRSANFFNDHLNRYSKSRGQAPIYWPLQTPSGSYTLWIYYQRVSDQILYTCVNDFVEPKLETVSDELRGLLNKPTRSRTEEMILNKLVDLEAELKNFRDELLRLAQFWRPNLNDGVQITAAPLWKLFQHQQWQKKLEETWDKLEKGEYDWAHLAYSIWPERVLRKCHEDRSLAITHDVENDFWEAIEVPVIRRGKDTGETKFEWQPKNLSETQFRELIRQKMAEAK